jgi:signal recognition particle GTPase
MTGFRDCEPRNNIQDNCIRTGHIGDGVWDEESRDDGMRGLRTRGAEMTQDENQHREIERMNNHERIASGAGFEPRKVIELFPVNEAAALSPSNIRSP